MAWHSTWDKPEWNNEDVKYLLADLCNAINERLYTTYNSKVSWPILSGTSETPTPADFVGIKVTEDSNSWSDLALQISATLPTVIAATFYNSSFTDTYSLAELLTLTGYTSDDLNANLSWRKKGFYNACKDILVQLRYVRSSPTVTGSSLDYYTTLDGIGGGYPTPAEAWDNSTILSDSGVATLLQYEMQDAGPGMHEVNFKSVPSQIDYTYSLPARHVGANLIAFNSIVRYVGRPGVLVAINSTTGSFAGSAFSTDGGTSFESKDFEFTHTDSTPTLVYNAVGCPFYSTGSPGPASFSPSIDVGLLSQNANVDLNPVFSYT